MNEKLITIGLIVLIISSCAKNSSDSMLHDYKAKNATLMAENKSLENEVAELLDENVEMKKWVENLQKNVPEYIPFSQDLTIENFLFKKYDGTFPFGFARLYGYHIESYSQLEDSVAERTNVFILQNVDDELYIYLEEIAKRGNRINYYKDSKLGIYFEPDDLNENLRQNMLSSTKDNPIYVFGFFEITGIGGADHLKSYFLPISIQEE